MNVALQMKQFINSEHTGDYIDIYLNAPDASSAAPVADDSADGENAKKANAYVKKEEKARIHYMEAGSGEPLILVHTIGQSIYTWRKIFNELSEYYRVIAVDLLGHGFSSRPIEFDYTVEEYSASLCAFMDALGIESAHFVAFSMGSAYVLDLVAKNPQRVGRVMLIAPGGLCANMPLSVRMLDSGMLGGLASRLYNIRTVNKILDECFFDLTNVDDTMLREYYHTVSDPDGRHAVRLSIRYFDDTAVSGMLRSIKNDVMIVYGAEDKWRIREDMNLYHSALPVSKLACIRNAGHLLHEEKPDRVIETLLEHIPPVRGA